MSFKLKSTESPYAGLQRLLLEQCETISRALESGDLDHGIHETRKCCKHARAVLKLLKTVLPAECKSENQSFRDTARKLSAFRDQKVILDCFEGLLSDDSQMKQKFQPLHNMLRSPAGTVQESSDRRTIIKTVIEGVEAAKMRISRWELPEQDDDWDDLLSGIKKRYQCARRKMKSLGMDDANAVGEGSFHNWRKGVKELAYYFRMLRASWPRVMKATAKEFGELADLLGSEHDLSVLQNTLYEEVPGANARMMRLLAELTPHLNEQRQRLRGEARALGLRLFTEKPKAIKQRLSEYVKVWLQEEAA